MDKTPIYPGVIPLDTNWLQPQRNTEIALGFMMQAAFGTSTLIDGLAVTQTASPSMAVLVGPGSIIFNTTVDTLVTGFGSLPVDNTDPLVKIGINLTPTTMSLLTAPGTAGQSQNWLVEAQFLEADGTPVVLPFYNASNPATPYTGPANAGTPSNTARTNRVQLQWKGGTAATTGTQNTPSPDAGWVGVAIVTVANGQSSITSSSIFPYSLAPFVPTKLSNLRHTLTGNLNMYVATTGSDTANSGLAPSSPFLTLQKAWNYINATLDLNGFSVTVNVANGTYSSGLVAAGSPLGYGSGNIIYFVGNTTTPTNCVISVSNQYAIAAISGAVIAVEGFSLTTTGTLPGSTVNPPCLLSDTGSGITIIGNMNYGACAGAHIWAAGGSIQLASGYTISGGAQNHFQASNAGFINCPSTGTLTITLTGTPAFSISFASAYLLGCMQVETPFIAFSGSATGTRYSANVNGVIQTNGGGATYFPGSVAGATGTGGQYV